MKPLKILGLFLVPICFCGCSREDDRGCRREADVLLKFEYPNFSQAITRVNVGVFDANGLFVTSRQVDQEQLAELQGVALRSLKPGNYQVVCWGNAFDSTLIEGFSSGMTSGDGQVSNPNYGTDIPITTNDPLYYGKTQLQVKANDNITTVVHFTPAYIRFIVSVTGLTNLEQLPPANYPVVGIHNLKAAYNFDMEPIGPYVSYYPAVSVNAAAQTVTAKCNVLRFDDQSPIAVDISERPSGKILATLDLQQYLADNSIEIRPGAEVTLLLLFAFSGQSVDVSVVMDKWGNVPLDPDL